MPIKVLSFDVGGTLIDNHFLELVWNRAIPELYARQKSVSLELAKEFVLKEYNRVGDKNINWYLPQYWFKHFNLEGDPTELFKSFKGEVKIYPEVPSVLETLAAKFDLVVSSGIPHNILEIELEKLRNYFKHVFSSISNFKLTRKTSKFYGQICQIIGVEPSSVVHVGDDWQFDYVASRKIGVKAFYLDRAGRETNDFIIKDLKELEDFLLRK
ncbi:MAG: HAD family hydrolase [Thermoproteota archaeon]|nr:HAD family hydrolase [Thermoproteota archaeon]